MQLSSVDPCLETAARPLLDNFSTPSPASPTTSEDIEHLSNSYHADDAPDPESKWHMSENRWCRRYQRAISTKPECLRCLSFLATIITSSVMLVLTTVGDISNKLCRWCHECRHRQQHKGIHIQDQEPASRSSNSFPQLQGLAMLTAEAGPVTSLQHLQLTSEYDIGTFTTASLTTNSLIQGTSNAGAEAHVLSGAGSLVNSCKIYQVLPDHNRQQTSNVASITNVTDQEETSGQGCEYGSARTRQGHTYGNGHITGGHVWYGDMYLHIHNRD